MPNIFEFVDRRGRKVSLTKDGWKHIRVEHPNVESLQEIEDTLKNPDKVINDQGEGSEYFFKHFKHKKLKSKFLKIIVKYINMRGNILSVHFVRNIK